jgi:membrane protein
MIGKFALGWYLGRHDFSADYGSAGALVLILFWVYYTCMILLFGAELTEAQVEARGVALEPEGHARRVATGASTPSRQPSTPLYAPQPSRGGRAMA